MKKLIFGILALVLISWSGETITKASYYADRYEGRIASDGSTFRQNKLTAATNLYPLGTKLCVTNEKNGKSVEVKVTDRLAKKFSHRIDLSKAAFKHLASLERGIIDVNVEEL